MIHAAVEPDIPGNVVRFVIQSKRTAGLLAYTRRKIFPERQAVRVRHGMLADVRAPFVAIRPVQIKDDITLLGGAFIHRSAAPARDTPCRRPFVPVALPNQRSCESGRRMTFTCQSWMATLTVLRMCPWPSLVHSRLAALTPHNRTDSPLSLTILLPDTLSGAGRLTSADARES